MVDPNLNLVRSYLTDLQDRICSRLKRYEGSKSFIIDDWDINNGSNNSSGSSRILEDGHIFEKVGINFSDVRGDRLPKSATTKRPELAGASFQAMGVSVVIHPLNPHVPTTHMNVRFIHASPSTGEVTWWFGGGFDLTPCYGYDVDAIEWHQKAKIACDTIEPNLYQKYKKACDDYFYLPHRKEARGIGGLFFDDTSLDGFEKSFALAQSVGNQFMNAYEPILARRKDSPFTEAQRQFQLFRRGRYVEFNLVYDRGTLFGLQSNGRTESILMSLPPKVRWDYNWKPKAGSQEALLGERFLQIQDWASMKAE